MKLPIPDTKYLADLAALLLCLALALAVIFIAGGWIEVLER